ncbi:UPF0473 protein YrzB [Halolactibacillus miurensis]|jgi:uncharacterized protein YrzB (UPF0473 family)|uniref:UPF0473 protein HAL01_05180 n=2 Tax=Halolactibacillus TaxID=306539 RepID=A0A511WZD6_9BACI|nr:MULTISPECIES: DUF1292 domain-containing protein [Halolactibacillus]SFO70179.1 Uncharacterized protein YrzB, UPF0473 family [Halolactibacillus alkaliphilus]SFS41359.1 Uncharacterized protein YrzB, UPF0473 family [Halolactibacillus miurensis]GEM03748.1 UPF0473 protein YrzB [Halolactibacillus miurensis]GEN56054.1 UPF0473 protein YrzB [Halolactibacillus alkaliphilus]GGN67928.1 UPF0473 protein YrzB [Halolactibacillus alkaliphilus]
MALIEEERIIIPGENGEENLYEVIFTFDIEENNQSYVAVVPVEQSEDEEQEVFVFRYEEKDNQDDLMLFSIESDEEWDIVEETFNTLVDQMDL